MATAAGNGSGNVDNFESLDFLKDSFRSAAQGPGGDHHQQLGGNTLPQPPSNAPLATPSLTKFTAEFLAGAADDDDLSAMLESLTKDPLAN